MHFRKHKSLGRKLGFTIGYDTLGYGCVIPHWGTIVVGNNNRIGKYPVLQTSTCISGNGKIIGDGLYLATGAKITSKLVLGNNISIGANSLVNKSFEGDDAMLGGMPAKFIKESPAWYIRDGFEERVNKIEQLRNQMGLS